MEFKERTLIFSANSIYDPVSQIHVMMDWEDEMMKEHARAACHNQGDVLEIGFGMGISASYIQSFEPKSHTIIEIHPQVLEKLYEWSKDKENVKIIEGDWFDNFDKLELYDGIFFDTFLDNHGVSKKFIEYLKPGGVFTFYNGSYGEVNHIGLPNCEYKKIKVKPVENRYFRGDTYWLPIFKKD